MIGLEIEYGKTIGDKVASYYVKTASTVTWDTTKKSEALSWILAAYGKEFKAQASAALDYAREFGRFYA